MDAALTRRVVADRSALGGAAMKTVLFACVHNAGRSQIAAAWFNQLADSAKGRAISAGTNPGTQVHPEVVAAMREVGVDLAAASPARLTPELAAQAQMLVTMGCGDECPYVPGVERDDWPLEDPKGKPMERVREIRDEIRDRVARLIEAEGLAREGAA
jgi:arsenate reductase